jgi:hypothetical protein
MNDERSSGPRAPRPIPRIRSELDILYDQLGGPADGVAIDIQRSTFAVYCKDYPSRCIVPILHQYQSDESSARKHWPFAAVAIGQYHFEIEERAKYSDDEPTPNEVEELLLEIERSAGKLKTGLCRLEALSYRMKDPTAPWRREYLAWLDAFVFQAVAEFPSNDVNEIGLQLLVADSAKQTFVKQLAVFEVAAKFAGKILDKKLLKRERGQTNSALPNFVRRCAEIWESMTGRKPSANKIHGTDRKDPDFVIFLQRLARIGQPPRFARIGQALRLARIRQAPKPTRDQVAVCLRNLAPANTKKKIL